MLLTPKTNFVKTYNVVVSILKCSRTLFLIISGNNCLLIIKHLKYISLTPETNFKVCKKCNVVASVVP